MRARHRRERVAATQRRGSGRPWWPIQRREVSDGADSRLDFYLSGGDGPDGWLEVKSVSMSRQPGLAEWPDAKSARGARHLQALAHLAAAGAKSTLLFLAQRSDCTTFRIAAASGG